MKRTKTGAKSAIMVELMRPDWTPQTVVMICESIEGDDDKINCGNIKVNEMIKFAAELYDTTKKGIYSKSRLRENVLPRSMIYYHLRHIDELGLDHIGRIFKKHHATILHGVKAFEKDLSQNFLGCADKYILFKDMINS